MDGADTTMTDAGNRRECRNVSLFFGCIFGTFAIVLTTVWYFGGFEDQNKSK